jgi:hypothetical protein
MKDYGFHTEEWLIPSTDSQWELMGKTLNFIRAFDGDQNLFILYYGGHGRINKSRQAEWLCGQDANSASVDWSAIQSMFSKAKSDVLILLDTCAAASSAAGSGAGVMETIVACGFEARAPPPGEHSFTNMLIDVLDDWINKPSFSASSLHTEILFQLKQKETRKGREGVKLEWCVTPIYIRYTQDSKAPGIELCRRKILLKSQSNITGSPRPTTFVDAMDIDFDELSPAPTPLFSLAASGKFQVPHVLISIALEEHQPDLDVRKCARWLESIPLLAKWAKIQGVYQSFSTLMILSTPIPVWNMLPDHPACSFIGYVTTPNMYPFALEKSQHFKDRMIGEFGQITKSEESVEPLSPALSVPLVDSPNRSGLDPASRNTLLSIEIASLEEQAEERRNMLTAALVEKWRSKILDEGSNAQGENSNISTLVNSTVTGTEDPFADFSGLGIASREQDTITPVSDAASIRENVLVEGQVYYNFRKEDLTAADSELLAQPRHWSDAPALPLTTLTAFQPPSANDAIARFNALDYNIASRCATWGTRRRSITMDDFEFGPSGSFLKKLAISRQSKQDKQGFMGRIVGVAKTEAISKLKRSHNAISSSGGYNGSTGLLPLLREAGGPPVLSLINPITWSDGKTRTNTEQRQISPHSENLRAETDSREKYSQQYNSNSIISTVPPSLATLVETNMSTTDGEDTIFTAFTGPIGTPTPTRLHSLSMETESTTDNESIGIRTKIV